MSRIIVSLTRHRSRWGLILLLAFFAGCGPGNPLGRQAVSGSVTIDGAPLDQGSIEFNPVSTNGVSSGGIIKDGAYAIPAIKGLPPGKYLVRIHSIAEAATGQGSSPADAPASPGPGMPGGPQRYERIAAAYNRESREFVEVISGQEARFNFPTKSKQPRAK